MPNPKTQRTLGWLAAAGVLTSCFSCGLIYNNQITAAIIALLVADFVLIPTFVLLLRTRRRTKRIVQKQEDVQQEQLDALAEVSRFISSEPSERTETEGS